jgi:hypothetical protein
MKEKVRKHGFFKKNNFNFFLILSPALSLFLRARRTIFSTGLDIKKTEII